MKRRSFILSLLGIPAVVKGLGKKSLFPFEKERIFRDSLIKKNVNFLDSPGITATTFLDCGISSKILEGI